MIVTVPDESAVTRPSASTVAMDSSDEMNLTDLFTAVSGNTDHTSCSGSSPLIINKLSESAKIISLTVSGLVILISKVATIFVPSVEVTFTFPTPGFKPLIIPSLSTVNTSVFNDSYFTAGFAA